MAYTLQIIHNPNTGGENVIEMHFDNAHQAEAEQRRHAKMKHKSVQTPCQHNPKCWTPHTCCETYIIMEPLVESYSIARGRA